MAWLKVCSDTGVVLFHSSAEGTLWDIIILLVLVRDSQRIHAKNNVDIKEIKEPKEETIFHEVKASG